MDKIELAKWLHDNYEAVAKEHNWNTQENCKVEFDTLPEANKRTMIEIADRLLNFNLLRLHFVVGRSEQLKCDHQPKRYDKKHTSCKKCGKILQIKP
jgi:hypothetical protein